MANSVPTPRSYNQVLGDMISAMLARLGLPSLKVGSPLLAILEAAAQSDMRSEQALFEMLASISLDNASGDALDKIGADEELSRQAATASNGFVNFLDASFTKISSTVYAGLPPVQVGSSVIYVTNATLFPNTGGAVYIGRGTINAEGPITYNAGAVTQLLNGYWSITLNTPTTRFHNVLETVILAQGGDRTISAGTVVQTTQGLGTNPVKFNTLTSITIPDGETYSDQVTVVCQSTGSQGNAVQGAINTLTATPFNGASVINNNAFTSGTDAWDDDTYRDAIRNARQTKEKGTALAITTGVVGTVSTVEGKKVQSASIVQPQGSTGTLFIDDGTGYEEISSGIGLETLVASAMGGEQYFQLAAPRPVAKAFVKSTLTAPFTLQDGATLSVIVGGVLTQHSFSASQFISITNASAYEVAASINANPVILFSAKVSDSATKVFLVAKADTHEDIQVIPTTVGIDANTALGFTSNLVYSLKLYKNNILLYKDGRAAQLQSAPQSNWSSSMGGSGSETIVISVDGTPYQTVTITNADFINAGTAYTSIRNTNSLQSWAAVFNYKIPGITASVLNNQLVIASNKGTSGSASVQVQSTSTLYSMGMFSTGYASSQVVAGVTILYSLGQPNDYTLDRNTAQIRLTVPLVAGDNLTAGSLYTRAFIKSGGLSNSITTGGSAAHLWFAVDGTNSILPTGVNATTTFAVATASSTDPTTLTRFVTSGGSGVLVGNIITGDWVIMWDASLITNGVVANAYRIANVGNNGANDYFEIDQQFAGFSPFTSAVLATNGIVFARTSYPVQKVTIPSTTTGLNNIIAGLNGTLPSSVGLVGATAGLTTGNKITVTTNTFGPNGDIALLTADLTGQLLTLPAGVPTPNQVAHLGYVESVSQDLGTPSFTEKYVTTATSTPLALYSESAFHKMGSALNWSRSYGPNTASRFGVNNKSHTTLASVAQVTTNITQTVFSWPSDVITFTVGSTTGMNNNDFVYLKYDSVSTILPNGMYGPITVTSGTTFTITYVLPLGGTTTDTTTGRATVNIPTARTSNSIDNLDHYDHYYYSSGLGLAPDDTLSLIVNNDTIVQNYSVPMYRRLVANNGTFYPNTSLNYVQNNLNVLDKDSPDASGNPQPLNKSFGNGFDFSDFAVYMQSRTISHPATAAKTVLWHYTKFGPEGNTVRTRYVYPTAANATVGLTVTTGYNTYFNIGLSSGASKGPYGLTNNCGVSAVKASAGTGYTITYVFGFVQGAGTIATTGGGTQPITITANIPTGGGALSGLVNASTFFYITASGTPDAQLPNGSYQAVSVVGSTFTINRNVASGYSSTVQYKLVMTTTITSSVSVDFTGGTALAAGDLVNVGSSVAFTSGFNSVYQVLGTPTALSFQVTTVDPTNSGTTNISTNIPSSSAFTFYPLNATNNVVNSIVTSINALTSPNLTGATPTGGSGTGTITASSEDDYIASSGSLPKYWQHAGGVNYIQSSNITGANTSQVTFKVDPTIEESTISGVNSVLFTQEEMRFVPVTAAASTRYLSSPAVSGIYANSSVQASTDGTKVQVSTLLPGSIGGVQVTGGTANRATAPIYGTGSLTDTIYTKATIASNNAAGLLGNTWVSIQSPTVGTKVRLPSTATLSLSGNTAVIGGGASFGSKYINYSGSTWVVEKQGNFVHYTQLNTAFPFQSLNGTLAIPLDGGDIVYITGTALSPGNRGAFRIVRYSPAGFWIVNPNAVEEVQTTANNDLTFYTYNSAMPGDTLSINTNILGAANQGNWVITAISTGFSTTTLTFNNSFTTSGVVTLGSAAAAINVVEATPKKLYKYVHSIVPNPTDPINYKDIVFYGPNYPTEISAANNSSITALDKFGFTTSIGNGTDGYADNTGLIAEVNRVVYGDERDPASYPGILATGANLNINGPQVKRIQVSLAIRGRTGTATNTTATTIIIDRVKSAVATVINNTGVGDPIAISDLVKAASNVEGVLAVSVLSPSYSVANDLISIQPYEKPLVLDLDTDILVSLIGA